MNALRRKKHKKLREDKLIMNHNILKQPSHKIGSGKT